MLGCAHDAPHRGAGTPAVSPSPAPTAAEVDVEVTCPPLVGPSSLDELPDAIGKAEQGEGRIQEHLVLTRYNPSRVADGEMLSVDDVKDILAIPLLGVIPESTAVLSSSNSGVPVIMDDNADAGAAYDDLVARFLGEERDHRFLAAQKKGLFGRLFGT